MSSKQNVPQLKAGDVVAGRFRIVEEIGSGGFSVVYRAHQEAMNRFVALKVLKPTASSDEKLVERFRREALFASHLSHPNTITLFDYGHTDDGLCYIAMEYLVGTDLAEVVQTGEPMALERVWNILIQCCRSLAEAHKLGLVHRDLKPENIFLVQRDDGEFVKVLDFGVSKAVSNFANAGPRTMAPLTQEGTVFGTPLYMAPEQAMAESITPSVDVYALGHIAYEMISGQAAYIDCASAMDVMLKQINDPPLTLPDPWATTPFSELILRCTAKEPEKRIQDASKLIEHLLHDAFKPYMGKRERPRRAQTLSRVGAAAEADTDRTAPPESPEELQEIYRWELDTLEEVLDEVCDDGEMRLVLVRGTPGSGRSNVLRAFLNEHRGEDGLVIAHRQSHTEADAQRAGLEADLACVLDHGLEGQGVDELKRMLHRHESDQQPSLPPREPIDHDSAPISALGAQRDTFLSRILEPFRQAAEQGALIWGLENLEKIDTLTLAFLDHFFNDLKRRPAPVLIVATVYADDLMRRPGLLRYTQGLMQATKPVARQLSLVPPGERKADDPGSGEVTPPDEMATQPPVGGSYMGDSVPTLPSGDYVQLADESSSHFEELDAEHEEDEPRSEADIAFDSVLGFLAELGDAVPEDLWKLARARVLPGRFMGVADFIVEQAERFGIVQRRDLHLVFTQPGFAEELRRSFDQVIDQEQTHLKLASLILDYFETPTREQLRTVVRHLRGAKAPYEAIGLLIRAGEDAFKSVDLDSAREYYLQVRQLLEDIDSGRVIAGPDAEKKADFTRAQIWVRLGEIHGALGEHGAAEDAVGKALDPEADASAELRGRAFKILGDLAVSQERFEQAKTHYRHARDSFREAGHRGAFVAAMGAMGHCALRQGRPREAEELLDVAIERAGRLKNEVLSARLGRFMGQVLVRQGRFEAAVGHLEKSLAAFDKIDSPRESAATLDELGSAAFAATDFAASRAYLERALELAGEQRMDLADSIRLDLGRTHAALGELDTAYTLLGEALERTADSGDRLQHARVHLHMGDVSMARQRYAEAVEHFAEAEQIAGNVGHTELRLSASIRRAYLAFDAGDSSSAYDQLSQTMQLAEELDFAGGELQVRAHVIFLQLLEHDFRTRGATFALLLERSLDHHLVRSRVICQLFKADVHAAHGELDQAQRLLEKARLGAAELGDHALLVPIARRTNLIHKRLGEPAKKLPADGFGIGALVPPEVGRRRFDDGRMG